MKLPMKLSNLSQCRVMNGFASHRLNPRMLLCRHLVGCRYLVGHVCRIGCERVVVLKVLGSLGLSKNHRTPRYWLLNFDALVIVSMLSSVMGWYCNILDTVPLEVTWSIPCNRRFNRELIGRSGVALSNRRIRHKPNPGAIDNPCLHLEVVRDVKSNDGSKLNA
jgi:hypothetical protein